LTRLVNKWTQLAEDVYSEWGGLNIVSVGRLGMWTYRKMKFEAFIHNDDVKCFHLVIQGAHKMVMMGCINFEDQALIKR
jgi:hypothetical protein